ncbi:hypothetical protein Hanom_Chr09g00784851 [Helianthus anomalus]
MNFRSGIILRHSETHLLHFPATNLVKTQKNFFFEEFQQTPYVQLSLINQIS